MEQFIPGPPAWYDWDGTRWYRKNSGYYLDDSGTSGQPGKRLHVAVWERANGRPLPAGHIVHHDDHDRGNNQPGNLVAVTRGDHNRHHQRGAVRDATARQRISEGSRAAIARRKLRVFTCQNEPCGRQFSTQSARAEVAYCSRRCSENARRRRKRRERAASGAE
jgi:hypothetical protein